MLSPKNFDTTKLGIDWTGKPIRVLLAEDEFADRKLLGQILRGFGFEVIGEAINGQEFVEKYWATTVDIGFLDYHMPVKNGLETAKEILSQDPQSLLVMITTFSEKKTIFELATLGIKGFIKKPLSRATMAEKLLPLVLKVNQYRYPGMGKK